MSEDEMPADGTLAAEFLELLEKNLPGHQHGEDLWSLAHDLQSAAESWDRGRAALDRPDPRGRCEDCRTPVTCAERDRCLLPDREDGVPFDML